MKILVYDGLILFNGIDNSYLLGGFVMKITDSLEVQVTNEHLQKLINLSPVKALSELIWNSLDADATEVYITFEKNLLGGIGQILVEDNGHGISFNEIEEAFGRLGDSKKLRIITSPLGRQYHGKLGQGRFSGFVLGKNVKWESIFNQQDRYFGFSIDGNINGLNRFNVSTPQTIKQNRSGVKVSISQLFNEKTDQFADPTKLTKDLSTIFAPYLLAYKNINIYIDGIKINPDNYILEKREVYLSGVTENNNNIVEGQLVLIEWKDGNYKNIYYCGDQGVGYLEENSGIKSGIFSHTFYLQSKVIDDLWKENQLVFKDLSEEFEVLRKKAKRHIGALYREKLAKEAAKEIKKIKEQKIYPYDGEPKTEIELAERQVFDICAYKINQYIPDFNRGNKQTRKFTYRLLKESLESNPNSLKTILQEILNLPEDQQNELANLLEKTSLTSMINTTRLITNRISFIYGLEQILYSTDYHKRLKERSQLHKILLGELWIFGEKYQYGYDDISLKNVLKDHLQILGRTELIEEIDSSKIDDLNDIPDIGLWKQCVGTEEDSYENLVIELKRPSCTITQKEISQIERYAYTVEENSYFDKEKTKWKFILIGIKLDKYARRKISQSDREPGLISKTENIEVWVKEWNQIIQETKGKHKFLKDKLELEIKDNEEGLNYLRTKYKEYLPE